MSQYVYIKQKPHGKCAQYGIYSLVFVLEILLVHCTKLFRWYKNNEYVITAPSKKYSLFVEVFYIYLS